MGTVPAMPGPRIPPLPPDDREPRTAELMDSLRFDPDGGDLNLFATLAHHPRLLKRWAAFGGLLLFGGELTDRDRELLILRTSANTDADYEWSHHQGLGQAAGLTQAEIDRVFDGPGADGWSDQDRTILNAADELHHDGRIGDATWEALSRRCTTAQLIEIPMVVGQYHLVAFTVRSLGIEREAGSTGFPR